MGFISKIIITIFLKFYLFLNNFLGLARQLLNKWHKEFNKERKIIMTQTNYNCIAPLPLLMDQFLKEFLDIDLSHPDSKLKTNIYTNENGNLYEFSLPGIDKKDIEITFEDNVLSIQTKNEDGLKNKTSITINYKVEEDKITSSLENGILRITMPKLVEEKKNINITIA